MIQAEHTRELFKAGLALVLYGIERDSVVLRLPDGSERRVLNRHLPPRVEAMVCGLDVLAYRVDELPAP